MFLDVKLDLPLWINFIVFEILGFVINYVYATALFIYFIIALYDIVVVCYDENYRFVISIHKC